MHSINSLNGSLYQLMNNKQISHVFLFRVKNFSPKVINVHGHEAVLSIILATVNNFHIKQKKFEIFVLLYPSNTKQDRRK